MVNANELRIGNWIHRKFNMSYGYGGKMIAIDEFVKVAGIDSNKIHYDNLNHSVTRWDNPEEFQPIPLTPELLGKCGFVTADAEPDFMQFQKGDVCINNDGGLDGMADYPFYFEYGDNFRRIEIAYLHQLQNLYFALTGEELEVTL